MTKFKEIYNRYETIEKHKQKRELLNMKLAISILNKAEKKQIATIKKEIKRLTIIIGDRYLDAEERMQLQIKATISDILRKEVTEETAYNHAEEIEEYVINQDYQIKEQEFENELDYLYETYEQLGYIPQNAKKSLSTIKSDTIQTNKKDYINQVLYELQEKTKEEQTTILQILREEITNKTKTKAIKKIRTKHFKLV